MVYFNTVVHPFLLADNRHYTFYVVRILMLRHWSVKYLAIPIYLLCGWLVIFALGGTAKPRRGSVVATMQRVSGPDTVKPRLHACLFRIRNLDLSGMV